MEFSCDKKELQAGVSAVEKIVTTRSTLPIIGYILFEAGKNGLKISANNLEMGIELGIKAKVDKPGSILVPARTLSGIVDLSLMRYSAELVPDAFSGYFEQLPGGGYRLVRLPAEGDPMMARIHRVRSVEFVMTDAIDEKYRELHEEVDSVYEIWRKYRRWYADFKVQEAQRNELRESNATRGSYEQLRSVYDNYRMDRLAAQEQDKWIVGFNNETAPVIKRMDERIAEMNGWVEDGYLEWTRILGELFELESGLD